MLKLLSKFLDVLPSVMATVLAAWIITHFINPKSAEEAKAPPKAEVAAPAPKAPLNGASGMSPRAVETVAVKPTAEEPAEPRRPARDKAATQPQPKEATKEATKEAKAVPLVSPTRADERKVEERNATDLARAALDRLRQDAPEPARAAVAPVLAAPAPAVTAVPAPVAIPTAPALPPPVVITAPRDMQPALENSSRPVPPADIPSRADGVASLPAASEQSVDNPSLFGGLKSAAKSLVETVIPR